MSQILGDEWDNVKIFFKRFKFPLKKKSLNQLNICIFIFIYIYFFKRIQKCIDECKKKTYIFTISLKIVIDLDFLSDNKLCIMTDIEKK